MTYTTRFSGLGFTKIAPSHWQFIDLESGSQIGPRYASKAELLADLSDYAQRAGFLN